VHITTLIPFMLLCNFGLFLLSALLFQPEACRRSVLFPLWDLRFLDVLLIDNACSQFPLWRLLSHQLAPSVGEFRPLLVFLPFRSDDSDVPSDSPPASSAIFFGLSPALSRRAAPRRTVSCATLSVDAAFSSLHPLFRLGFRRSCLHGLLGLLDPLMDFCFQIYGLSPGCLPFSDSAQDSLSLVSLFPLYILTLTLPPPLCSRKAPPSPPLLV